MVAGRTLDRPVQLRHEESDNEDFGIDSESESDASVSENSFESHQSEEISKAENESRHASSEASESEEPSLKDISFGALARAQESLGIPPRKSQKRKFNDDDVEQEPSQHEQRHSNEYSFSKPAPKAVSHRTSKHAPSAQSSRYAVSRKREIFAPSPSLKSRDPRFDPAVSSAPVSSWQNASDRANKNYSFLTAYQESEIASLKGEIQKAKNKDPRLAERLKRQMMSLDSKLRNAETRNREREVRMKHQQSEREAIRAGKKSSAYYLKDSEVKRMVRDERIEAMGKKERDKLSERRQKREKAKQAKDMPWERRSRVQ